jgi:hypothetical protein
MSSLATPAQLGPIANEFFGGKNPWTDGFPAFPSIRKELDLLLEFVASRNVKELYLSRLRKGKPAQRYEYLNEIRVAYYFNSIGFEIADWEKPGNNPGCGEFTISRDREDAIFVEVKSPGWEGTLTTDERKARRQKYSESDRIRRVLPNWGDVRKCIERAYPKFSSNRANLVVIAADFFAPLDNRQMRIALFEPAASEYGPGHFTSEDFRNLGGVTMFVNETDHLKFSEETGTVPRYGHLFYSNPYALNCRPEKYMRYEERPCLRRIGSVMAETPQ